MRGDGDGSKSDGFKASSSDGSRSPRGARRRPYRWRWTLLRIRSERECFDRPLRFEGILAFLRATASSTGFPAYDGVQIQNVPRLSSFVRALWTPAALPAEFSLAWTERSRRNARRAAAASRPCRHFRHGGVLMQQRLCGPGPDRPPQPAAACHVSRASLHRSARSKPTDAHRHIRYLCHEVGAAR